MARSTQAPRTRARQAVLAAWLLSLGLAGCRPEEPTADPVAAPSAAASPASPYVSEIGRDIKALAPQEVEGLLEGRGMGFAQVAELNGYPGPLHALELAGPLGLTETQLEQTQDLFDEMKAHVSELGARLVERERQLDGVFATGSAESEAVESALLEIGELRARIRNGHVQAHLRLLPLLTPDQVAAYDSLRGYSVANLPGAEGESPTTGTSHTGGHSGDHSGHH